MCDLLPKLQTTGPKDIHIIWEGKSIVHNILYSISKRTDYTLMSI